MLLDPRKNIGQVEDRSIMGTDGMRKGLKRERTEVEGKALECGMRTTPFGLSNTSARAGRECLIGRPLGMRDLYSERRQLSVAHEDWDCSN